MRAYAISLLASRILLMLRLYWGLSNISNTLHPLGFQGYPTRDWLSNYSARPHPRQNFVLDFAMQETLFYSKVKSVK
ncbi:HECT-type ubiquitin ligase-interacting protein creD [Fusarium oxysporum f. sp. albedinis]|nr:HECT-type ubiquitin ligase-interacting protein creD [Fusarium oxysporum f. sp. albedinis]